MLVLVERLKPLPDAVPTADDDDVFAAFQIAVLEVVNAQGDAAGEAGIGVDSIAAALDTTSLDDVRKALASLVLSGYCYTTIDEGHVLAT